MNNYKSGLYALIVIIFCITLYAFAHAQETDDECAEYKPLSSEEVKAKSSAELVNLIIDECILWNGPDPGNSTELVEDELVRRKAIQDILLAFGNFKSDFGASYHLVDMFERIGGVEVEKAFKQYADHSTTILAYLSLKHFAKKGERWALERLNKHYFEYPVSSLEWSEIATLFGKYRYEPAAENLANSVNAASMNLGAAAHDALCKIYPKAAKDFEGPGLAEQYWLEYIKNKKNKKTP